VILAWSAVILSGLAEEGGKDAFFEYDSSDWSSTMTTRRDFLCRRAAALGAAALIQLFAPGQWPLEALTSVH
jgi:hypothetical protein